jgi:hypothetical protein
MVAESRLDLVILAKIRPFYGTELPESGDDSWKSPNFGINFQILAPAGFLPVLKSVLSESGDGRLLEHES